MHAARPTRPSSRPSRQRDPTERARRAREAQASAAREETGDAFEVAADAWEEAGAQKQADRMRMRANELYVEEAIRKLERSLETIAREAGHLEYASIEPRGDHWLSELDEHQRGKSLEIAIPNRELAERVGEGRLRFDAVVSKTRGANGWSGGWQLWTRGGGRVRDSFQPIEGPATEEDVLDAIESAYRALLRAPTFAPDASRRHARRSQRRHARDPAREARCHAAHDQALELHNRTAARFGGIGDPREGNATFHAWHAVADAWEVAEDACQEAGLVEQSANARSLRERILNALQAMYRVRYITQTPLFAAERALKHASLIAERYGPDDSDVRSSLELAAEQFAAAGERRRAAAVRRYIRLLAAHGPFRVRDVRAPRAVRMNRRRSR